jgi:hypothetical protein
LAGAGGLEVPTVHYAVRAHGVDEPEGEIQRLLRVGVPDVGRGRLEETSERPAAVEACLVSLAQQGVVHRAEQDDHPQQPLVGAGEHDPVGPPTGARAYQAAGLPAQLRDCDQFARLAFSGLDLVPPGVLLVSEWRPDNTGPRPTPSEVSWYGGVARNNPAGRCAR